MQNGKPVAVVAGAGPGNGAALARRFVEAGYAVALLARGRDALAAFESEIAGTRGYPCDVGDAASVERAFAAIRSELGEVYTLLYNAGSGVFADVETITPEQFEQAWRVNAYGALLCAREVIPAYEGAAFGEHHLHRCNRLTPRRHQIGSVRPGQGGAAQPRQVDGA